MVKGMAVDNTILINVTFFQMTKESEVVMLTAGELSASVT
jgi:hypothetical protein